MTAPWSSGSALLEVTGLSRRFGGLQAVSNLSLRMDSGEILGLIGPNGAGKTTAFNLISGFLAPDAGDVRFRGLSLLGLPPHAICARGLCRTFQIVRPFAELTVLDNVEVGALIRHPRRAEARRRAAQVLERVGLAGRSGVLAGALTLAERKRLELARALATEPALLLLDEVMAGLTVPETEALVALVRGLPAAGTSVLLIEHNLRAVMTLSHRLVVLSFGQVITEGRPEEVARDPRVIEAYLGSETDGDAAAGPGEPAAADGKPAAGPKEPAAGQGEPARPA